MRNKKKIVLILIVSIVLVIGIIYGVGSSFGLFSYTKEGNSANMITVGNYDGFLSVSVINNGSNTLNLTGASPVADSDGLDGTPFVFDLTNSYDKNISYKISVVNDEAKLQECVEQNGTCPQLSNEYIRFSYKIDDGQYSSPQSLSDVDNIIATPVIASGATNTISVILWVYSGAGSEVVSHSFFGKLAVSGTVEN